MKGCRLNCGGDSSTTDGLCGKCHEAKREGIAEERARVESVTLWLAAQAAALRSQASLYRIGGNRAEAIHAEEAARDIDARLFVLRGEHAIEGGE